MKAVITALLGVLAVPFVVLNLLGGIAAGIWLAILGEWGAIGYGILASFVAVYALSIALLPQAIFAMPAAYLGMKGRRVLMYLCALPANIYGTLVITIWCVAVLYFFTAQVDSTSLIPLLIWSYSVAMTPLVTMAKPDLYAGDDALPSASLPVTFLSEIGYIVMICMILFTEAGIGEAGLVFVAILLVGMWFLHWRPFLIDKMEPEDNSRNGKRQKLREILGSALGLVGTCVVAVLMIYGGILGYVALQQHREQARMSAFRKDYAEVMTERLEDYPDNVEIYLSRGSAYALDGDYGSAVNDFTKAITLQPNNPEPYILRCRAYRKLGKHEETIPDCNKVLEVAPEYAALAYYHRGLTYAILNQLDQALEDLTKALAAEWPPPDTQAQPDDFSVRTYEGRDELMYQLYLGRGVIYLRQEKWEHARSDLEEARKLAVEGNTRGSPWSHEALRAATEALKMLELEQQKGEE